MLEVDLLVDFVDEENTLTSSIEYSCNAIESLLTAWIPKLQFDETLFVDMRNYRSELCPNGDFMFLRESIMSDSFYNTRFAYTTVAY